MLDGLKLGVGPSELHGSLTVFSAPAGKPSRATGSTRCTSRRRPPLPPIPPSSSFIATAPPRSTTPNAFRTVAAGRGGTVDARADALVDWCRGFLGGLGLAGGSPSTMSDDASEILRDIGTIAGSRFEYENAEEDESALEEVIEFVRVGVLLLHTEMTAPERRDITLH